MRPVPDDELQYALDVVTKYGTAQRAVEELGLDMHYGTLHSRAQSAKKRGMETKETPPPPVPLPAIPEHHFIKGVSTLLDPDGNIKQQWVKSQASLDRMRKTAEEIVESLNIKARKPQKEPQKCESDFLTVYPMGDPHIGMYAWHEETSEDFDCEIAESQLCAAADGLVSSAMSTEKAMIANLGDFFHADNQSNTTSRNNNPLDVDTRKQRVMRIGVRIMNHLIDTALKKHKHVTVINEVGNHDDESSYVLSLILDAWYRDEPRVEIDLSPATFHYYRFHKVLIGVTHGHRCKPDQLGQVMAADRKEDWGQTDFHYWLVGHIHHITKKEVPGCVIESFRTLAAKDAWHSAQGYRSGRDMNRITYHKDYGEVSREIKGIKEIIARLENDS